MDRCCFLPHSDLIPVSLSGGPSVWLDKPEIGSHRWHLPLVYHRDHSISTAYQLCLWNISGVRSVLSVSITTTPVVVTSSFLLESCHSLLSALVLVLLQFAIYSATSWLGTLKFKTLQNLFLKWLGLAHISSPISNFLSPPHPHRHLLIPWRWNLIPVSFPFWAFAQAVPEILPPLAPHNIIQIFQMILP